MPPLFSYLRNILQRPSMCGSYPSVVLPVIICNLLQGLVLDVPHVKHIVLGRAVKQLNGLYHIFFCVDQLVYQSVNLRFHVHAPADGIRHFLLGAGGLHPFSLHACGDTQGDVTPHLLLDQLVFYDSVQPLRLFQEYLGVTLLTHGISRPSE